MPLKKTNSSYNVCDLPIQTIFVISINIILLANTASATNIFFSNSSPEDLIEIRSNIMDKNHVGILFNGNQDVMAMQFGKHINIDDMYLVVGLKNTGNRSVWGELMCTVENNQKTKIFVKHLGTNMKKFVYFVQPLHGLAFQPSLFRSNHTLRKNDFEIGITWKKLYAK